MSITTNGHKFVQLKNLKTLIDLIKNKIVTNSLKVDKKISIGKNTTIDDNNGVKTHKVSVGKNTISSTEAKLNKLTITSIENDDKTITINNKGITTENLTADEAKLNKLTITSIENDDKTITINNKGIKTNNLTADEAKIAKLNSDAFINDEESNTDKTYSSSKIAEELNKTITELKGNITTEIEKEKERAMAAEEELKNAINNVATEPMGLDF